MAYCFNCGRALPENAGFCPDCGADQRAFRIPAAQNVPQQPTVQVPSEAEVPVEPAAQPVYTASENLEQPLYTPPVYIAPESPRQPDFVTQMEAPKLIPGKSMGKVGKILGIFGFVEGTMGMAASILTMFRLMQGAAPKQDELTMSIFYSCAALMAVVLCVLAVMLSRKAESKGNPNTRVGKRFGLLGLVFSAVALVSYILCAIVLAFSGTPFI